MLRMTSVNFLVNALLLRIFIARLSPRIRVLSLNVFAVYGKIPLLSLHNIPPSARFQEVYHNVLLFRPVLQFMTC